MWNVAATEDIQAEQTAENYLLEASPSVMQRSRMTHGKNKKNLKLFSPLEFVAAKTQLEIALILGKKGCQPVDKRVFLGCP